MIESQNHQLRGRPIASRRSSATALGRAVPPLLLLIATPLQASMLSEGALDTAAEVLSWVVLVVAPVAVIGIFLFIHILPEKLAEKRRHPQLAAIKTLCFLSLVFGGLLWPIAWLWAFTKPVLYKQAYGTDVSDEPPPPAPAAVEQSSVKEEV